MSRERWERVKQLFASALEREPGQRAAYVAQACAADEEMEAEVESLLMAHESAAGFLSTPPEVPRRPPGTTLAPGARLGPYEIVELIGSGGMGQVYRARDARLERHVAVKVLPQDVSRDAAMLDRFKREARMVA